MVRSAAAILALLILPGFAPAQQAMGRHDVVNGDTLWDLSARYYGNPFDWRRIWDANRDQVDNPNLILPGQVLNIPDTDVATVRCHPTLPGKAGAPLHAPRRTKNKKLPSFKDLRFIWAIPAHWHEKCCLNG